MSEKYNTQINLSLENEKTAIDTLARTIWGEARGESVRGKEAVASTIINRVKHAKARGGHWWGNEVIEVCLKPWQFSCWNENDPNRDKLAQVPDDDKHFKICKRIARRSFRKAQPDPTNGATHYHTKATSPWWAKGRTPCASIGNHLFYKNVG